MFGIIASASVNRAFSTSNSGEAMQTQNSIPQSNNFDESCLSSEAQQSAEYSSWSSDAVYNGGETVLHNNKLYKAKWWTQGEEPGKADVWLNTMQSPKVTDENEVSSFETNSVAVNKSEKAKNFKVVGYYPAWDLNAISKADFNILTHVIYAFAIPTEDGGLRPLENPENAVKLIKAAHDNNAKVLIAIGGWSYNDVPLEPVFAKATDTADKREAFAKKIIELCDEYGFDGVDMDWEHPRVDGQTSAQYESLMLMLSERLHANNKLLTSAVLSGATADNNIYYDAAAHTKKVLDAVDWLNIMAYDGGDGERHSSYNFAVDCVKYWGATRGVSNDKIVLGVPFYARPSWAPYKEILKADEKAYSRDISNFNGVSAHYNGVDTIKRKTAYALENGGGIMIWEISQDTDNKEKSLLSAVGAELSE